LKESNKRFDNRKPEFLPDGIGISVDIFPYTIDEFKRSIKENLGIGIAALNDGIVIYSSKNKEIENFGEWFKRYEKE
jgi:hypothetical protein